MKKDKVLSLIYTIAKVTLFDKQKIINVIQNINKMLITYSTL